MFSVFDAEETVESTRRRRRRGSFSQKKIDVESVGDVGIRIEEMIDVMLDRVLC